MVRRSQLTMAAAALLFGLLCLRLGVWQLDRAAQAESRAAMVQARQAQAPLEFGERTPGEAIDYRRAVARGRFEPENRIWLDDRKRHGRRGFHLIEPLRLAGSDERILVNRGWVGRPDQAAPADSSPTQVEGLVARPAAPALRLASGGPSGVHRPYLDTEQFGRQHGYPVSPYVLIADPEVAGERIETALRQANRKGMHIGYAMQWFVFALLSLALAVVGLRARKGEPSR